MRDEWNMYVEEMGNAGNKLEKHFRRLLIVIVRLFIDRKSSWEGMI
jgi:flagellar biosynthesis regulator FlaF